MGALLSCRMPLPDSGESCGRGSCPAATTRAALRDPKGFVSRVVPKRHNSKGRSTTDPFVRLPHWMLKCPAWRSLSPVARCVLIELLVIYNGRNNGYLAFSARDAAERVGCSKGTANRGLAELREKGFIDVSIVGAFYRKTRHATEYRLSLFECDRTGSMATKEFMRWSNPKPIFTVRPQGQSVSPEGQ